MRDRLESIASTKGRKTHLAKPVDRLLVADRVRFEVVLRKSENETCDRNNDTLRTKKVSGRDSKRRKRRNTHQVLIVEDGDDTQSPVGGRDDFGVLAVETEEGEGGFFLDKRFGSPGRARV